MPQWTAEQQSAIAARNPCILVSAGAGSGKTAVLVERIMGLALEDGVDIDRMLIVTFTKAAASEMRQRIAAALEAALAQGHPRARRQLQLLPQADISTLHAFCSSVLRGYFYLIGLDPALRVGDEAELNQLSQAALEAAFEEGYREGGAAFRALADRYTTSRSDAALREMVLQLDRQLQSQPDPEAFLRRALALYDEPDPLSGAWARELMEQVRMEAAQAGLAFQRGLRLAGLPGIPPVYGEWMGELCALAAALEAAADPRDAQAVLGAKLPPLPNKRKYPCPDEYARERLVDCQKEGKKALEEARKLLPAGGEDVSQLREVVAALAGLWRRYRSLYEQAKAAQDLLDFNDLEHRALELLALPEVREAYHNRFDLIFVDEYQDSNRVQEALVTAIRRDGLFMVGDVKQSIYRFRLADPTLFLEKYAAYQPEPGAEARRIDLNRNFRSRREVLAAVNGLFSRLMTPRVGDVAYGEAQALVPGLDLPQPGEPPVEVHLLDRTEGAEEDGLADLLDAEAEALFIAQRIGELVGAPLYDPKQGRERPLQYRDMVILMRSPGACAPAMLELLLSRGIPAYADAGGGYLDAPEVQVLLNALRLIDNPRQDVPLISVLHSPLFDLSLEELTRVRAAHPEGRFFDALAAYRQPGPLLDRLAQARAQLERWRADAQRLPLAELVLEVLDDRDFYNYAGLLPGGKQRQANLMLLVDRARAMQESSFYSLPDFLQYLDPHYAQDMGAAQALGEQDDVVRIMSVHRSKGLEFPVVFLAGLGRQFNRRDAQSTLLVHGELGIALREVDPELRARRDTLPYRALAQRLQREGMGEEMRVAYVALTRARDRLILVGSVKAFDAFADRCCAEPADSGSLKARSMLEWFGPVLLRQPDAAPLRELAASAPALDDRTMAFRLALHPRERLGTAAAPNRENDPAAFLEACLAEPPADEAAEQAFSWRYPHPLRPALPPRAASGEEQTTELPRFMQGSRELSAAERGTLLHGLLQRLDLSGPAPGEQARALVEREHFLPEQVAQLDLAPLAGFLASPLCGRMRQARLLWREVPFTLAAEDGTILQGVIDCCFLEGDHWVLVDYKSDHLTPWNRAERLAQYRAQINRYARALEQLTPWPVGERLLYLLLTGEEIPMEPESPGD